ncbi:MAG TPA: hypothetical protein VMU25_03145 [Candidatus Paceibacterota bacterium]|nr:hypothetical protein [Candidatus Paceibacterota bacterium]
MEFVGNVQLVRGGITAVDAITKLLEKEGVRIVGNPDVYEHSYTHFGVEEARELSSRAQARGIGGRRVFIITAAHMTTEAQNALLKTLEEPSGNALFFLVVPSPEMLLPTLRSRASLFEIEETSAESAIDVRVFLKAAPEDRIEMLKPLLDKTDDDRRDLGSGIAFLAALERELSTHADVSTEGLETVYRARKYWADKGALGKVLLEQVALLL